MPGRGMRRLGVWVIAAVWLGITFTVSAAVDTSRLPESAPDPIVFYTDIFPIFENSCLRCHGPNKPKSGYRLDRRDAAIKGGDIGEAITVGDGGNSPLIHYVAGLVEDMEMPPEGKGEPLTQRDIMLLRAWIDQGAVWDGDPPQRAPGPGGMQGPGGRPELELDMGFGFLDASGSAMKFMEHQRTQSDWTGGVERFRYVQPIGRDRIFMTEGGAYWGRDNYRLQFELRDFEKGYIRIGADQSQRNFDGVIGAPPPGAGLPLQVNEADEPDTTRFFVEAGLRDNDWPELTIRYEYTEGGTRSMIESISPAAVAPGGPPDSRTRVEEKHLVTFKISDKLGGWFIEDNARMEWYDLKLSSSTTEISTAGGPPRPGRMITTDESARHLHGVNSIIAQKEIRDGWFVSVGHLYAATDGDASFTVSQTLPPGPPPPGGTLNWFGNGILLANRDHVFNLSTRLGPWRGWTLSAGAQSEFEHREGFGNVRLDAGVIPAPVVIDSNFNRNGLEETVELRYDRIPNTVAFAEADFRQESIGQFDRLDDSPGGVTGSSFLRDTDASSDRKDFRLGFTHSRWRQASFTAQFEHRDRHESYTHLRDENFIPSPFTGLGYSAFIRGRDTLSEEMSMRLSLRPTRWLQTQLKYRYESTDFTTEHDGIVFFGIPQGTVFSGEQLAHIYSANFTLTPWRRLYFTTTVSLQD
ncbi:MAG: c-type cytochrome domain-containing protein, partial [Verrucomicrobiia bacterium]